MRIDVLSKEYPPEVYGGAGVHVDGARPGAAGAAPTSTRACTASAPRAPSPARRRTPSPSVAGADANAGDPHARGRPGDGRRLRGRRPRPLAHLVRQHGRPPRVAAARHPARRQRALPRADAAVEGRAARRRLRRCRAGPSGRRTRAPRAIVAVSAAMRDDVLRSYPDGRPGHACTSCTTASTPRSGRRSTTPTGCASSASTPTGRRVIFVGRITRQKGLPLFLRAAAALPPEVQLVLCAGAPDTPEIMAEVSRARRRSWPPRASGVVWIDRDAPAPRRGRAADRRDRLRLPVDLRAARHRQPRGDGLRDRRRRHRDRRHPRGRRATARPAGWSRSSRPTDGTGTPLDPETLRRRPRRRADRGRVATPSVARGVRPCRPASAPSESFSWDAIAGPDARPVPSLT